MNNEFIFYKYFDSFESILEFAKKHSAIIHHDFESSFALDSAGPITIIDIEYKIFRRPKSIPAMFTLINSKCFGREVYDNFSLGRLIYIYNTEVIWATRENVDEFIELMGRTNLFGLERELKSFKEILNGTEQIKP